MQEFCAVTRLQTRQCKSPGTCSIPSILLLFNWSFKLQLSLVALLPTPLNFQWSSPRAVLATGGWKAAVNLSWFNWAGDFDSDPDKELLWWARRAFCNYVLAQGSTWGPPPFCTVPALSLQSRCLPGWQKLLMVIDFHSCFSHWPQSMLVRFDKC